MHLRAIQPSMASPRKFVLAESEAFTIKMVQDLIDNTTFIRSISEEAQNRVMRDYSIALKYIKDHGSEHKITLDHVRGLCEELIMIRHFTNAATILDRACLGCKRCYGSDHVNVALVLSRQAFALGCDRKFTEAVDCYMKSLRLMEMLFDFKLIFARYSSDAHTPDELEIIPSIAVPVVDGLGYTLGALQRHAESEFYFRILLHYYICGRTYESARGRSGLAVSIGGTEPSARYTAPMNSNTNRSRANTDTFASNTNVNPGSGPDASNNTDTNSNSNTISINTSASNDHPTTSPPLGKQHPEALQAVNKLAKALQSQNKFAQADTLVMDSLDDCIHTLGANHPTTQTSVVTVAQLKHAQGKLSQAEEMYRRSLACNEEVLGSTHVETLSNIVLIAGIRAECKDYSGAQTLYTRALSGYKLQLGPLHSSTIDCVHCIGAMLLLLQRPTAALLLLTRAYEERVSYYGPQHPTTLATLFCIGKGHHLESLWKHRPDYSELVQKAIVTLKDTIRGFDGSLGSDSVQSIECCDYLSSVLLEINRFDEALPYSRRVYNHCNTGSSSGVESVVKSRFPVLLSKQQQSNNASSTNNTNTTNVGSTNIAAKTASALQYGPLHRRTAEAAYRLATLLENCTSTSSSEDAARHVEAAGLFMQTHEAYSRMLSALSSGSYKANVDDPRDRGGTSSRRGSRFDSSDESTENKLSVKDLNDSAQGDEPLSARELRELIDDAMEQHHHALRRSLY